MWKDKEGKNQLRSHMRIVRVCVDQNFDVDLENDEVIELTLMLL